MKKYTELYKENVDEEKINVMQDKINIFNYRKENLKSLILGNIDTDKDIQSNYEAIVGDNEYLAMYGKILNIQAKIERRNNAITNSTEDINNTDTDRKLIAQITDPDRKKKLEEDLIEKENRFKENIENYKKEIAELEKEYKELELELKQRLDLMKKEIVDVTAIKESSLSDEQRDINDKYKEQISKFNSEKTKIDNELKDLDGTIDITRIKKLTEENIFLTMYYELKKEGRDLAILAKMDKRDYKKESLYRQRMSKFTNAISKIKTELNRNKPIDTLLDLLKK